MSGVGARGLRSTATQRTVDGPSAKDWRGGGEGGHNGLRSISKSVSTKDYARLRVGIGRPPGRQDPSDFVLSDFPGRERADLGVTLEQAADAVEQVVTAGFEDAQQRLHAPR